MPWTVTTAALAEGVEAQRRQARENRSFRTLERLGRALPWVDLEDESCAVFHDAALDLIDRFGRGGRGRPSHWAHIAGFFILAGEREPALEWCERALVSLLQTTESGEAKPERWLQSDAEQAVSTLYVCGDQDRAAQVAEDRGISNLASDLVAAQRARDVSLFDTSIVRLTNGIAANRLAPFVSSGQVPIDDWDWLELASVQRARAVREAPPSHTEMLERTGLLGRDASR